MICGPTATGKTELAARLAKKFGGELVSADSRQVYKYMDIGTGKDKPEGVAIWGYDLVFPNEEFSVSQYVEFAHRKISEIAAFGRLPILVGGTGFYIKAVIDGIDTINVPKNEGLRKEIGKFSVGALQTKLRKIDSGKFSSLNDSDVNNPRRLIRAIEVAEFNTISESVNQPVSVDRDVLFVGLQVSEGELRNRIEERVEERIKNGFEEEIEFLRKKDYFRFVPSTTIGYKDWPDVEKWKREEFKYAKRQMVWFKKDKRIKWLGPASGEIENYVRKWHNSDRQANA